MSYKPKGYYSNKRSQRQIISAQKRVAWASSELCISASDANQSTSSMLGPPAAPPAGMPPGMPPAGMPPGMPPMPPPCEYMAVMIGVQTPSTSLRL
mmetsp:Transcript_19006/g.40264  ORF Transcript_19006/g.40264 Transcript_19006/m.40264 type:complete len:96 (-) Transcript_19006:25-312(-)